MQRHINIQGGNPRRRAAKVAARDAIADFDTALADLTGNWDGLTVQQQRQALRRMLIVLARTVYWLAWRD